MKITIVWPKIFCRILGHSFKFAGMSAEGEVFECRCGGVQLGFSDKRISKDEN